MMDRVNTGVPGLDGLVGGGFPKGLSVLVTGSCGTGKTILSLQYLHHGALNNEPGVYVTFEESRKKILEQARVFKWDLPKLEKNKLLDIYVVDTVDMDEVLSTIKEKVDGIKAKRLVIDSLTMMLEYGVVYRSSISKEMSEYTREELTFKFPVEGHKVTRKDIYFVVREISRLGTTSLLVSELGEKSEYLSRDTISEFASDGVILLKTSELGGEMERLLSVRKMRGTEIDMTRSPMKFTPNGVAVEVPENA